MTSFTIPARYYARGCVDWNGPVPAKGYAGEKTKDITLTTANTAIICMHPENTTYPGGPVIAQAEPGTRAYYDDWFDQYRVMIEERLAPLFQAARNAGVQIMYNVCGWRAAENYPRYRQMLERVKTYTRDYQPPPPSSAFREWRKTLVEEALGKDFRIEGDYDIAPPVAAGPEDWLVWSDDQASTLLAERGIWNVLLTGVEATSCFLNIPGGVWSMCRLGYRCFIVEDCSLAMETRETREGERLKNEYFKSVQLVRYCYITQSKDIIDGLTKATTEERQGGMGNSDCPCPGQSGKRHGQ